MDSKQKEIVKTDERAIKDLEVQMDKIWNEGEAARKKGDNDTYRDKVHEAEALRPKLDQMHRIALDHVNGDNLNKRISQ